MQKLMGDEGWGGGGACFSLLTPSVCVENLLDANNKGKDQTAIKHSLISTFFVCGQ